MKNGMLIWNVLLTLAVGYLIIFGIGNKSADSSNDVLSDSTFKDHKQFRIAYFIMDSVAAHFGLVKQVKDELSNKEDAITAELDQMNKNIQNKYVYYQNKAQAGTLTQAESDAAGKELKKLDDDMKARQKKLDQDYFDLRTRKETEIKDKIEAFCKEFNKKYNFNYIVSYEQGLFFYKDTTYNITKELIKGLNEKYKFSKE